MSAVPDSGGAVAEIPRLGAVLVQRGLLTEDQLSAALEEQQRSGRPLGETLVSLGFVAGPVIGQALATQHGGLLKTEYGFATGFPPEGAGPAPIAPPAPPATHEHAAPQQPKLRVASPLEQAPAPAPAVAPAPAPAPASGPDPRDEELQQLRLKADESAQALEAAAAKVSAAEEQAAAVVAERDAAQEEAQRLQGDVQRLEQEVAEARAQGDTLGADVAERAQLNDRLSSLQQRLDEAFEQLTQLRLVREELAEAAAARDGALARVSELEAELAEARAAATAAAEQEPTQEAAETEEARFLALIPTGDGYRLVELDGRTPAIGSRVELPTELGGTVREVLSVGGSPLPASALRCVHLI